MMNKKAQIMVFLVTIFAVIAIFMILTFLSQKYESNSKNDGIGSYAYGLINAYQKEEKAMLYLDTAAKQSLISAIMDLGDDGVNIEIADCGVGIYNLWNYGDKNCIPDYEKNLKTIFLEHLDTKLLASVIPISADFDLTLKQEGSNLEITGMTDKKITLSITSTGETVVYRAITGEVSISEETVNRINQYNDIIERASLDTGVSQPLIKAVITQESAGRKDAISEGACAGIMQFCYPTAQGVWKLEELVDIWNLCKPLYDGAGKKYSYECKPAYMKKDVRFDPEKEIPAGAEYLRWLNNYGKIADLTTDRDLATIAAYNGGAVTISVAIKRAIKRTEKTNPTWEEISAELTRNLLKSIGSKLYDNYSGPKLDEKINQIRKYVERVGGYYYAWGGTASETTISTTTSSKGYYQFEQNFKTSVEYDFSFYEDIETFAKETIEECNDEVETCLERKRTEFNEKYTNTNTVLLLLEECEDGEEKVFYDFINNLNDCAFAWGEKCRCQVTEDYTDDELKSLAKKYNIFFYEKDKNEFFEIPEHPEMVIHKSNKSITLDAPVLAKDFYMKKTFGWMPTYYGFEYEDNTIKNTKIHFENFLEEDSNKYKAENFEKIYIAVKDDEQSWMIENDEGGTVEIEKKGLGRDLETETGITNVCPVAKQTFNLCVKTSYYFPTLTGEGIQSEESKIKFAINLVDETAPSKINDLKGTLRLDNTIMFEWTEEKEDVALYELYYQGEDFTSVKDKESLKKIFIYEEKEMVAENTLAPMSPENYNYQQNTLFYKQLEGKREYHLVLSDVQSASLILSASIDPDNKIFFAITGTDNFKNKQESVKAVPFGIVTP